MNKIRKTYRYISGFLALLMLSINIGFSADVHICGGEIADIAFYGHAHSCGEMDDTPYCDMSESSAFQKISKQVIVKPTNTCCKDFTLDAQMPIESNQVSSADISFNLHFDMPVFIPAYPVNTILELDIQPTVTNTFETYQSPMISRDISVLLERFLI